MDVVEEERSGLMIEELITDFIDVPILGWVWRSTVLWVVTMVFTSITIWDNSIWFGVPFMGVAAVLLAIVSVIAVGCVLLMVKIRLVPKICIEAIKLSEATKSPSSLCRDVVFPILDGTLKNYIPPFTVKYVTYMPKKLILSGMNYAYIHTNAQERIEINLYGDDEESTITTDILMQIQEKIFDHLEPVVIKMAYIALIISYVPAAIWMVVGLTF